MEPKLIEGLFVDVLPFFVGTIFFRFQRLVFRNVMFLKSNSSLPNSKPTHLLVHTSPAGTLFPYGGFYILFFLVFFWFPVEISETPQKKISWLIIIIIIIAGQIRIFPKPELFGDSGGIP